MVSTLPHKKTTTCLTKRAPLRIFGSQFIWDLAAGDIVIAIPPTGKYFYISTTSLNSITRIICKIGGPNEIKAISSRVSRNLRTYTLTCERRFLYPENKIVNAGKHDYRTRSKWSDEEWIQFFKGVGRSKGTYKLFLTVQHQKLRNLSRATKLYWELMERAGLFTPKPP